MAQSFIKDKDAILDFEINWSAWLAGDTIATSTWEADAGIAIDDDTDTDTTATAWLSGGTAGKSYLVTNHIVTAAGRKDDRTLKIYVGDK